MMTKTTVFGNSNDRISYSITTTTGWTKVNASTTCFDMDTTTTFTNGIRNYMASIYRIDSFFRGHEPLRLVLAHRQESIMWSTIFVIIFTVFVFSYRRRNSKKRNDDILKAELKSEIIGDTSNYSVNRSEEEHIHLERKLDFIQRVGLNMYGYTSTPGGYIDHWRSNELPALIVSLPIIDTLEATCTKNENNNDEIVEREVYLDYAGSALPTQSQIEEIVSCTTTHTLANPHSIGPAALRTKQFIEQAKKRILDHFHANPGKFYGTTTAKKGDNNCIDSHPGYEIVFTSGTTDAMRIVAERFPWSNQSDKSILHHDEQCNTLNSSMFVYAQNSHTSVIGIREEALQHRYTKIVCQPIDVLVETILQRTNNIYCMEDTFNRLSMNQKQSSSDVDGNDRCDKYCRCCTNHLLVLPVECNFGGDRHDVQLTLEKLYDMDKKRISLECQQKHQQHMQTHRRWYTMLDIAKAASTGPVNLCQLNPDFACISFYKMFGEPTGLGCLLVKRTTIDIMFPSTYNASSSSSSGSLSSSQLPQECFNVRQKYIGGGSVNIIVPGSNYTVPRAEPSLLVSLTHGTPHFRGIVSLLAGFNELDRVGGMDSIHRHTQCLAEELVRRLHTLRHNNGRAAVEIYCNWKNFSSNKVTENRKRSGPTVAFNVLRSDGSYVGYNEVSKLAGLNRPPIQLRTGCFCNPGACQIALNISDDELIRNYEKSGHVCGDPIDIINNRPIGAIRISFGKDSIWEDMNALVDFLEQMFVNHVAIDKENNTEMVGKQGKPVAVVITELYIFPIKSCGAQRVPDWQMDKQSGRLRFDREFALVDSSGSAMRMQMYPAMALLQPFIDLKNQTLTIQAPGSSCLTLVLRLDDQSSYHTGDKNTSIVKVCGNRCTALVWGDHAVSEWFSRHLGVRCWLARYSISREGLYEHPDLPSAQIPLSASSSLSFANEQPLLLISENAVHVLNDAMRFSNGATKQKRNSSVCSRQFRPNIVVRTSIDTNPSDNGHLQIEDYWRRISLVCSDPHDFIEFDVLGPCARCAMVDIDPSNGSKVKALRALAAYRRHGNGQITFGIFLRARSTNESVSIESSRSKWLRLREGNSLLCE
jgi:molybdenum cofactor sulfurtransferase